MLLDASALLAYLLSEEGAERVQVALAAGAFISAVNLAEVAAKLVDYGYSNDYIEEVVQANDLIVIPFSQPAAVQSGLLRRKTRSSGLSLGDQACLAVARATGLAVLTADRHWAGVDVGVQIELCR